MEGPAANEDPRAAICMIDDFSGGEFKAMFIKTLYAWNSNQVPRLDFLIFGGRVLLMCFL